MEHPEPNEDFRADFDASMEELDRPGDQRASGWILFGLFLIFIGLVVGDCVGGC